MKKRPAAVIPTGWFEVLFRRSSSPTPKNIREIVSGDYVMVSDPLPMSEFEYVFDVFLSFRNCVAGGGREACAFDVISLFQTKPVFGCNTYLVIPSDLLGKFGYSGCKYHSSTSSEMLLLPLEKKHRFQPFAINHK